MGVTIKNKSILQNTLNVDFGDMNVFIKFGTEWCIPCQELDKILVNIPNSIVYYVDVDDDEFEDILEINNINTLPYTFIKYKKNTRTFYGVKSHAEIIKLIDTIK